MEQGWELAGLLGEGIAGKNGNLIRKEFRTMKNSVRIGLVAIFIIGLVLVFYYLGIRFWPFYPMGGWKFPFFGPRMWPFFPFFGMLILFVAGILIAKYFFQVLRDSSISRKDKLTFCPYCGREISQMKTIPEVQPEKP